VRLIRREKSTCGQAPCSSGRADSNRRPLDPQVGKARFKAPGQGLDPANLQVGVIYVTPPLLLSCPSSRPSFNFFFNANHICVMLSSPSDSKCSLKPDGLIGFPSLK
jgi:hypothetical protein